MRDIGKKELMETVSFVFQNSRLVKASIFENVRMAKPDAAREEVMAALRTAQCMDIIERFPNGVDRLSVPRVYIFPAGSNSVLPLPVRC